MAIAKLTPKQEGMLLLEKTKQLRKEINKKEKKQTKVVKPSKKKKKKNQQKIVLRK